MFWAPEISRGGGIDAVGGSLWAALAVLPENGPVIVQLNDEVQLVARWSGDGHVSPGDSLTLDNLAFLERIEPAGIDPDAGWALLATLRTGASSSRPTIAETGGAPPSSSTAPTSSARRVTGV